MQCNKRDLHIERMTMRIDDITTSTLFEDHIRLMPILKALNDTYTDLQPFSGMKIGFAHVLAPNTLPMITSVLKGGAELWIAEDSFVTNQPEVINLLRSAGSPIFKKQAEKFDFVIDCGGYFTERYPHHGTVEVTRSGIHKYGNLPLENGFTLIDVDNSISKIIETFIGNPKAVIKTLTHYKGDISSYLDNKTVAIVGFGKIGRGLAREFYKYTSDVLVCDIQEETVDFATQLGYNSHLVSENISANSQAISSADIILTATGFPNVMSDKFDKPTICEALKINVGAVDEWGDRYSESEIFHSKHKPFNFNLDPPTGSKFIDPILAAQVEGLRYMIENFSQIGPGYHPLPKDIDNSIVNIFSKIHKFDLEIISRFFPGRS